MTLNVLFRIRIVNGDDMSTNFLNVRDIFMSYVEFNDIQYMMRNQLPMVYQEYLNDNENAIISPSVTVVPDQFELVLLTLIEKDLLPGKYFILVDDHKIFPKFRIMNDHQRAMREFASKHDLDVEGWFIFGSSLDATTPYDADIDVVVITDSCHNDTKFQHYLYDIQTITVDEFNRRSDYSEVLVAEVLLRRNQYNQSHNPSNNRNHFHYSFGEKLDLDKPVDVNTIRHTFSKKASHSYVKAQKKLLDGDIKAYVKSYFHSIRLMHVAVAICNDGDTKSMKKLLLDHTDSFMLVRHVLYDFANQHRTEDRLDDKAIELYKATKREFKRLCPKS